MQDSALCPRQYLHSLLLCLGALCRVPHQPGKHPPNTQVLGCGGGRATRMVLMPPLKSYGIKNKNKNKNRFNSRQAVRSNPLMSKEGQVVEVNQGTKLWLTSNSLAARFTSHSLLASSSLLHQDAIDLSAPNRTPVYHDAPSSLRAAYVQTSLSTPKVRRSVGVEPCRAPNVLSTVEPSFICKHIIILYNIFTSTDGAVRRMFLSFHLFWMSDYTFRYNIWTNQPGSHRRKTRQDIYIYIYIIRSKIAGAS